jgi:transposase
MEIDYENLSKEELVKLLSEERKLVVKQEQEIVKQEQEIVRQEQEIEWLRHQLAQLKRMQFGSKRERFVADKNQTSIEFNEYANQEEKQDQTPVKETVTYERAKAERKHNGRNRLPENLPVVEHVIEPEQDLTGMQKIGEERTEILEYAPEKFFKLVLIRPKYAKVGVQSVTEAEKNIVIAELPSRPIEKCLAGNRLLAAVLVQKYIDHLPLYRQQQIFARAGIEIAPSTMDGWVAQLGDLLELLYDKLVREIKAQNYLQADETTINVLDRNKKNDTHLGYFWVYHAPLARLVAFDYHKGRGTDAPRAFLKDYAGTLQTDGYAVYRHYYNNDKVLHLACWAHVRRKFEKALDSNKSLAEHALLQIQKLYAIEREIKELDPGQKKNIRLDKALPIINELGKWNTVQRQLVLPKSPIGLAIEYASSLWDSLSNYLHDGNLQIDNNLIENTIRPVALGRKNYLFAGSHQGAKRSAMFYSFFACCKLNNMNPQLWLEYVLSNIADCKANQLHMLLPNNIKPQAILNHKQIWEM